MIYMDLILNINYINMRSILGENLLYIIFNIIYIGYVHHTSHIVRFAESILCMDFTSIMYLVFS